MTFYFQLEDTNEITKPKFKGRTRKYDINRNKNVNLYECIGRADEHGKQACL